MYQVGLWLRIPRSLNPRFAKSQSMALIPKLQNLVKAYKFQNSFLSMFVPPYLNVAFYKIPNLRVCGKNLFWST